MAGGDGATAVTAAGLALACLSMVGNGTFPIFKKFCREEPDDVLFSACTAVGVCISSLAAVFCLVAAGDGSQVVGWTWPGALGGLLVVVAILFSFVAISLGGIATAQATWSCAAIVVSVLWGALGPSRGGAGPGAPIRSDGCTLLAVALLVTGVLVINLKAQLAGGLRTRFSGAFRKAQWQCKDPEACVAQQAGRAGGAAKELAEEAKDVPSCDEAGPWRALLGVVPALLVGVSGGSILVPMSYVGRELRGLPVLLSFGLAGGLAGTLMALVYWTLYRGQPLRSLRAALPLRTVLWGMTSGTVWNLGNICQIVAMSYLKMPYGISYPILQCAFVVGGLWGIFVFREVTDKGQIATFFAGVAVVCAGVVTLGLFGPGAL